MFHKEGILHMIKKELESLVNDDFLNKNQKKGYVSEQQMAFYLQRKFFDNPDIHILNNLYIKTLNDKGYFQIDHLIITKYCFIVVESKTCNSHVKFDEHLQWSCFEQSTQKWIGIKSPMKQAEMQGDALRKVLQKNRKELRSKFLFSQGGYLSLPIHYLVAISDSGIIDYSENKEYAKNVLKADLIPNRILEIYNSYKKRDGLKNLLFDRDVIYVLPANDIKKTIRYVMSLHHVKPVYRRLKDLKVPVCKTCKKTYSFVYNRSLKYYELICFNCGSAKKINFTCPKCAGMIKIHKYNESFVAGCETCNDYGRIVE